MSFGEWMAPRPSLAAQARLQHDLAIVRNATAADLPQLKNLTLSLLQQNMQLNTLMRQAVCHVADMELREFLSSDRGS
jgi:hypothetical protein